MILAHTEPPVTDFRSLWHNARRAAVLALVTAIRACGAVLRRGVLPAALLLLWAGPTHAGKSALVVYCGRGEALVGPILEAFEADTGVRLDVRYNKTPALATQLLNEGPDSPADVIFFQDSGYLGALAARGFLQELPQDLLTRVDPRFRDAHGRWIGVSGRARVLVYNPSLVATDQLPATLWELKDPKWKGRLGWAPGNSSAQAHISALRHLWGEAKTRTWLEGMQANAPIVYPKNAPQVRAAAAGEIAIGWVNHYYLHRLKRPDFAAANYSFSTPGDAGNILMVAGVGVRTGSPRVAAAHRLMAFLTSATVQERFSAENFEYPTRPGVPTHPDVPPLAQLNLAAVDQTFLADVGPTLALLQELGLQ